MTRFASLIVAASLVASTAEAASPLLHTYYASNNRVQSAVWHDACKNGDQLEENRTARARLRRSADRARYDRIASLLGEQYSAVVEPTDGNLEAVRLKFCRAADDR